MYRKQLDGLRFLAFLAVFLYHLAPARLTVGTIDAGQMGVHVFFSLSGFLITRILIKNETGSLVRDLRIFHIRRALRIFPLYYGVLILLTAIGNLPEALWHFLYAYNIKIYLVRYWGGTSAHFWSLCVEEQFYLVFPLLILTTPARFRLGLIAALLLLSKAARITLSHGVPAPWPDVLLPVCGEYLLWGCLAGLLDLRSGTSHAGGTRAFAAGLILLASWFGVTAAAGGRPGALTGTPDGIGYALVVLGLWRTRQPLILAAFSLSPLVYLGKISYGLYVFHNFSYGLPDKLARFWPSSRAVPGGSSASRPPSGRPRCRGICSKSR